MLLRPDQQKVHRMLTESIMMLCRNGLDFSSDFAVEGLLGITLDSKEVFLVNIKESSRPELSTLAAQTSASQADTSQLSKDGANIDRSQQQGPFGMFDNCQRMFFGQKDSSTESSPRDGIISGPLTPMVQPFKSPFRRQRGRRRFCAMEGRGMRRKFNLPHHRMMHAMIEAHKQLATDNVDTFGMPFAKRIHTEEEPMVNPSATVTSSTQNMFESKMPKLSKEVDEDDMQAKVKVEPVMPAYSPGQIDKELTIAESTGLQYGDDFEGSSPSTRGSSPWHFQEDGQLQQPHTPSSVDTVDTGIEKFEDSELSSVEDAMLSRVRMAILKEDGCFVTTRMLCRRYSAFFKSQIVVQAMKALTVPVDNPLHIGMFRHLKERSKVFYRCPPHLISEEALKPFNITKAAYEQSYFKMPKPKGMQGPRWEVFSQYVLDSSPYGPISAASFTEPVHKEEEVVPGNSMDEFELQQFIVHSDGCFVSSRILCRRLTKQYRVINVIRAMKAMSRRRGDKHYIGEFVKVSERIKIFFKCPPRLLGSEALQLYSLTMDDYKRIYYASPRPWDGSVSNWDAYMENVSSRYPYTIEDYPLDSCDVSPDVSDRIRTSIGSEKILFHPFTSYAQENQVPNSSCETLDMIRSSLAGAEASVFPPQPEDNQNTEEK